MPIARFARALLTFGCLLLILPALASAATYTVNSIGDQPDVEPGVGGCVTAVANCTLRAAIEESNASAAVDDAIVFSPLFNGEDLGAIEPATPLPEILSTTHLDGGICSVSGADVPCVAIKGLSGFATLSVKANESVVEHLKLEGGGVGIRVQALGGAGPGVEILENTVTGAGSAISNMGTIGGSGNVIAGNTIDVPINFNFGITISNGPNQVYGNVIDGSGCCYTGIWLSGTATGNRIGGDTEASENIINNFDNGAITLILPQSTRNEIGRNRGENGSGFINLGPESANGGIQPPAIDGLLQSSASGTAEPGAKVRLFRKATDWGGEIASFLGDAVADGSGNWSLTFPTVPAGTFVAGTQTFENGTSELTGAVSARADPTPPCTVNCGEGGGGGNPTPPPAPPASDTTAPVVTIKKAPKAKSTATTAKFRFVSNEAGSSFKCKLDKKAWANCKSPRTFKRLQPGKHVFKVKVTDPAGNVSAVLTRKFTVLEP